MDPGNESYKRALEMSSKAPQLYAELQKQLEAANENAMLSAGERGDKKMAKDGSDGSGVMYWSDTTYDALGWLCLGGDRVRHCGAKQVKHCSLLNLWEKMK